MTFRARLRLFFVLIVIVPMLSVAIVLFRLIDDSETGKANASIAARQTAAISLYQEAAERADGAVEGVGNDRVLAQALRAGDLAAAKQRAAELLQSHGIERIALRRASRVVFVVGHRDAIAPARRNLTGVSGRRFGILEASTTRAAEYARLTQRVTNANVVVESNDRVLANTLPRGDRPDLPPPGEAQHVETGDTSYRGVTFSAAGFLAQPVDVGLFIADAGRTSSIMKARVVAGITLLGFLLLALTFALAVSRSLQAQIDSFLQAARRLGGGDFSTDVPTHGRDEF